jgi:hypothetical protein
MDDWVAYAVVLGVVAATILGKILIARADKKPEDSNEDK